MTTDFAAGMLFGALIVIGALGWMRWVLTETQERREELRRHVREREEKS